MKAITATTLSLSLAFSFLWLTAIAHGEEEGAAPAEKAESVEIFVQRLRLNGTLLSSVRSTFAGHPKNDFYGIVSINFGTPECPRLKILTINTDDRSEPDSTKRHSVPLIEFELEDPSIQIITSNNGSTTSRSATLFRVQFPYQAQGGYVIYETDAEKLVVEITPKANGKTEK